jgi:hypothetical protein
MKPADASPTEMAWMHGALGRKDQTSARMEAICSQRATNLLGISTDPNFDAPRSDRRFEDLLRRMNFPE